MINLTFQELISSTYSNNTYINSTMNIPKYFPITNQFSFPLKNGGMTIDKFVESLILVVGSVLLSRNTRPTMGNTTQMGTIELVI